ncbi:MAG: LysR substrate-binding domain-containing protein [Planctomycetota bacterium]
MPTEHPDARHLRCFVAAAEAESVRAAARRLGLAQATVTEHIRRLESLLGFSVFDRIGRTVVLTEQGRLLLPRARAAVRAVEDLTAGIDQALESGAGRLTIGAIPTMSPYILPSVLSALRNEYPECEIVVTEDLTESLLERLDDHTIEAAVLSPPISHPRIECDTLGTEPMLVIAPENASIEATNEVTLRELRSHRRVSLSNMHCLGDQIESFCTKRDLSRQITCNATQLDTVFELVRLGLGVSLVPMMALGTHRTEGLRAMRLRREVPRRHIGLATRVGRSKSILADRFAALLELEVQSLARPKRASGCPT